MCERPQTFFPNERNRLLAEVGVSGGGEPTLMVAQGETWHDYVDCVFSYCVGIVEGGEEVMATCPCLWYLWV